MRIPHENVINITRRFAPRRFFPLWRKKSNDQHPSKELVSVKANLDAPRAKSSRPDDIRQAFEQARGRSFSTPRWKSVWKWAAAQVANGDVPEPNIEYWKDEGWDYFSPNTLQERWIAKESMKPKIEILG
jgi:hypothetical protein